jgi:uncharacterized protein YyaL (SSP411 family)
MRKILLYVAILFATSLLANEIHWSKDFQSGLEQAKKENKPVFFIMSKHTCPPCKYLAANTFKDEKVIKELNDNYVAIISYTDEQDYIPRELFTGMTPTMWFLKPDGEPMFREIIGAVEPENFFHGLVTVKTKYDEIIKKSGK